MDLVVENKEIDEPSSKVNKNSKRASSCMESESSVDHGDSAFFNDSASFRIESDNVSLSIESLNVPTPDERESNKKSRLTEEQNPEISSNDLSYPCYMLKQKRKNKKKPCAVFGCEYQDLDHHVKTYGFPRDEHFKKLWTDFCARDYINTNTARICARHFSQENIKRKYEILGQPPPKSVRDLKDDAVPDMNFPLKFPMSKQGMCRDELRSSSTQPLPMDIVKVEMDEPLPNRKPKFKRNKKSHQIDERNPESPDSNVHKYKKNFNKKPCAVIGCKYEGDSPIKMYTFPKDEHFKKIWIDFCGRDHVNNDAKICAKHFSPANIKRTLMHELLGKPPPKTYRDLKDDAIPDMNFSSKYQGMEQYLKHKQVWLSSIPGISLDNESIINQQDNDSDINTASNLVKIESDNVLTTGDEESPHKATPWKIESHDVSLPDELVSNYESVPNESLSNYESRLQAEQGPELSSNDFIQSQSHDSNIIEEETEIKSNFLRNIFIEDGMDDFHDILPPILRVCLEYYLCKSYPRKYADQNQMKELSATLLAFVGKKAYKVLATMMPLKSTQTIQRFMKQGKFKPSLELFKMRSNNAKNSTMGKPLISRQKKSNFRHIQVGQSDGELSNEETDADEGDSDTSEKSGSLNYLDGDVEDDLDVSEEEYQSDDDIVVQFNVPQENLNYQNRYANKNPNIDDENGITLNPEDIVETLIVENDDSSLIFPNYTMVHDDTHHKPKLKELNNSPNLSPPLTTFDFDETESPFLTDERQLESLTPEIKKIKYLL